MKEFIGKLVALAATLLIVACFGIPMTTILAVLIAYVLVDHLIDIVVKHIKEKTMPAIVQWVQYGFEVITVALVVCGINYANMYCLIFGMIAAIIALVCSIVYHNKNKAILDPEPETEEKAE